jgi:hypothetical protein
MTEQEKKKWDAIPMMPVCPSGKFHMKLYWESNSRVRHLAAKGIINNGDIVPRSRTDEFMDEAATVRLHKVREEKPFVTIHIRGKLAKQANSWTYAPVCRINLGGPYSNTMCSNGDLDENLTWKDVHDIVTRVKETMDI